MTHDEAMSAMHEMLRRQGVVHTLRIMAKVCECNINELKVSSTIEPGVYDEVAVAGWRHVMMKLDLFSNEIEAFTSGGNKQ